MLVSAATAMATIAIVDAAVINKRFIRTSPLSGFEAAIRRTTA
jgi:hypothetical protein